MSLDGIIETAFASDIGRVRSTNEDAVAVDRGLGLLLLADGMGGHNAGEVASGLAVSTALEVVRSGWPQLQRGEIDPATGLRREAQLLQQALHAAHDEILRQSQTEPALNDMGTTAVLALVHNNRLSIAYVGDSRLYCWRDQQLQQLTANVPFVVFPNMSQKVVPLAPIS